MRNCTNHFDKSFLYLNTKLKNNKFQSFMNAFDDLFNPNVEQAAQQKNSEIYKPHAKKGLNGVYRSVVRFIPWHKAPHNSVVSKTVAWVKNPATNQGMYIDDPRSVGAHSPISDMYWNMYNTKNKTYQDFAKQHLGSKVQYASLVQIIQDDQHPELVGEIKVFVFGQKVWNKLTAEMNPQVGAKGNPWQPITGRYFCIECTMQSGFNNFDNSMFFDNKSPDGRSILPSGMLIKNKATNTFEQVNENTDQAAVMQYLVESSPDLDKFKYTEWTPEQQQFVTDTINVITDMMQKGTIGKTPMGAIGGGYNGMTVNPTPQFPGAQMQPGMNYAQPGFQQPMPQMGAQPMTGQPMMGQPAPAMGGFVQQTPSAPAQFQGTGVVTGVEIPNVTPAAPVQPANPAPTNGFGNVDDIIAGL